MNAPITYWRAIECAAKLRSESDDETIDEVCVTLLAATFCVSEAAINTAIRIVIEDTRAAEKAAAREQAIEDAAEEAEDARFHREHSAGVLSRIAGVRHR